MIEYILKPGDIIKYGVSDISQCYEGKVESIVGEWILITPLSEAGYTSTDKGWYKPIWFNKLKEETT